MADQTTGVLDAASDSTELMIAVTRTAKMENSTHGSLGLGIHAG